MERIVSLKVFKVVKETEDAISIHFKQPFLRKIKYTAGQFLTLLITLDDSIERRCYSLNSAPNIDKTVSITVKRLKDGMVSNYLFNNVKEGDKIKVIYPSGAFTIHPDPQLERHVVLFGAGSGITPLISILKTILHFEGKSMVSLFYGNRDVESIIFNKELDDLKSVYKDRLNLIHILENPGDFEDCYKGRVERTQVPELMKQVPKYPFGQTFCYICGPSGMMLEAKEGLRIAGVPESNIFVERFSIESESADEIKSVGALLENREVTIFLKGRSTQVSVKANRYILSAALDEKMKLPYVCLDGICGTCKAECVSGKVHMKNENVLSESEINANMILPCISKPMTNNVVIKYS